MKTINPIKVAYGLIIILIFTLTSCTKTPQVIEIPPQPTRDPILESTIETQLESMNPSAVSVYQRATIAMDSEDYELARTLYEKVTVMAPGFSTAYRRLGAIEAITNNVDQAIVLLRKALELEPDGYNQSALAQALIERNTPKDLWEAFDLASAAAKAIPDDEDILSVWLISASTLENVEVLREADEQLLQLAPNSLLGHYMAGLLAANDGKWMKAEAEILLSQQLGLPSDIVQEVLASGISRNAMFVRVLRAGLIGLASWIFGLGILFLMGTILSKATIKALNNYRLTTNFQPQPEEKRIRSIYKSVIAILSLFYYISIPFVILLLFLVVGGAFYVFFMIGTIPIYYALILVVMLIGSLFAILRAVFSKTKIFPTGHLLRRIDAPDLWMLVEDVARKLAVRPVDSIIITPGVEIAVYEEGSILKKMRGAGQRNLILGMGVLSGLTQGQFAAVLAHEYGHFSNRDTAGGNMAKQVYISLHQLAQRLIKSRAAQIYNPAWLFVLGYQRIYLHVAHGASRLQEVLADRYAAASYGSVNLIEGLKNIIRQSIVFSLTAEYEIQESVEGNKTIINLYDLPMRDNLAEEFEKQIEEDMNRATSKYDSHPAPKERIAWIERMQIPNSSIEDNFKPLLHLFPNSEDLQRKMTKQITSN